MPGTPDQRRTQRGAREFAPNPIVPFYKDIPVTQAATEIAMGYLRRAPRLRTIHRDLGQGAFLDLAMHDDTLSRGRKERMLGGIRQSPGGMALAVDLSSDMTPKYLELHRMVEDAGAPVAVREAARKGGAKAVLWAEDPVVLQEGSGRNRVLGEIGRFIKELDGAFVPGGDMGTSPKDLRKIGDAAGSGVFVSCQEGHIDNSKVTAAGVAEAFIALVDHKKAIGGKKWQSPDLTFTYQGLGKVGIPLLLTLLDRTPYNFILFETNTAQIIQAAEAMERSMSKDQIAARISIAKEPEDPQELLGALRISDGFIPNAGANVITEETLLNLPEDSIYGGAANDVIPKVNGADDPHVLQLALNRNTTGFAAYQGNDGGIGAIAFQEAGLTEDMAMASMRGVRSRVLSTLREAHIRHLPPEQIAYEGVARHLARFAKYHNIDLAA